VLVQLSDPHIRADDDQAATRLEAVLRSVLALERTPDAVLISGDITDAGDAASCERARDLLAPLGDLPLHVLPGNHDDREALRATFGLGGEAGEPIVYSAPAGDLRLVCCDTAVTGAAGGRLDERRLDALDAELAAGPGTPTVLAMHHPPALTGVKAMDSIGLPEADRRALAEVVARHPQVAVIACGHAHRSMVSALAGRPVLICPSIFLALELAIGPDATADPDSLALVGEPPGYAFHMLLGGAVSSHVMTVDGAASDPRD
jgi:Icc protein